MLFHKITLLLLTLLLLTNCDQNSSGFRIDKNGVGEGEFSTKVLSPTKMTSNYPMVTQHTLQQPIIYKLSLNGKDNEAGFGLNHQLVIPEGITEFYAPTINFGVHTPVSSQIVTDLSQPANVHFRVDLRPILQAFAKTGFFITSTNDTIFSDHFEGLYLAGNTDPLVWVWDNPDALDKLRFQDADLDSIYEIVIRFEPPEATQEERSWELTKDISGLPQFSSPQAPLLEALTNLALEETILNIRKDGAFSAGKEWQGVWTRDISYAAQLSLAYFFPENVKTSLRAKLNAQGRIIQDTGTGGSWPISSDRHIWTLAAWEVFLATGDEAWLDEIREPVIQALKEDLLWNRDPISGMLLGETSFEDWREQTYPPWMSPAHIHASHALSTNIIFKHALEIGLVLAKDDQDILRSWPQLITRLDQNILRHFWSETLQAPASYIMTTPAWLSSSHRDLLGESLGILFCNSFTPVASQLVASYPRTPYGSPVISHQLLHSPPYHNKAIWPFVEVYALLAAKQAGNQAAYLHSFQGLTRAAALFLTHPENYHFSTGRPDETAINSDRQLWSDAAWLGAIYKGLFGISLSYDFDRNGFDLTLTPNNPFDWDKFSLTNFTLHDTPLTISLTGKGSTISAIQINGTEHDPGKPIALAGQVLDIVIHLEEEKNEDSFELASIEQTLPNIPMTYWSGDTLTWESETRHNLLIVNGRILDTLTTSPVQLPDSVTGFYAIQAMDSTGTLSLPSQPHYLGPSATLVLSAKAPHYIELGQENTFLELNFSVPAAGNYLLRFIYSNGSGPINTGSTCGLAKLKVNDWWLEQMLSFPHTAAWDAWQFTSWAKVEFKGGLNTLSLDQESLNVSNMDGKLNRFRVYSVELIPVSE